MASGYADLKNELVSAANGVAYAYWDPPLVDALASPRRVVAFDNADVDESLAAGGS